MILSKVVISRIWLNSRFKYYLYLLSRLSFFRVVFIFIWFDFWYFFFVNQWIESGCLFLGFFFPLSIGFYLYFRFFLLLRWVLYFFRGLWVFPPNPRKPTLQPPRSSNVSFFWCRWSRPFGAGDCYRFSEDYRTRPTVTQQIFITILLRFQFLEVFFFLVF